MHFCYPFPGFIQYAGFEQSRSVSRPANVVADSASGEPQRHKADRIGFFEAADESESTIEKNARRLGAAPSA
jgi:hypothetical protein